MTYLNILTILLEINKIIQVKDTSDEKFNLIHLKRMNTPLKLSLKENPSGLVVYYV